MQQGATVGTVKRNPQTSFVARFWLEGGPDETKHWRGHIRHVQGQRESYIQSISALKQFLEETTEVPVPEGDD